MIKEPFNISIEDLGVEDESFLGLKLPTYWTPEALIHYITYIRARMNWGGYVEDDDWHTEGGITYQTNDTEVQEFLVMIEREIPVILEVYETPFTLEVKDTIDGYIITSPEVDRKVRTEGVIMDVIKSGDYLK